MNKKFYNLFWIDQTCQTIFSMHKSKLLEDEVELIVSKEKFYAQRLVLTNSQKRNSETQLAQRTENENIELIHNLQQAATKYFDSSKIEALVKDRFGKTFKKIESDLSKTGGWWKLAIKLVGTLDSEKDLFKLLASYELIPEDIVSKEQFGKYVEKEVNQHVKSFFKKENLSELAISIDLISTYYNHKLKNNLVTATKHYTDILYTSENLNDRIKFFDNLYEIGVIEGGKLKSYYECVYCPPNTFNGILTINLKPSHLKMKCPCCKKELFYIVPYELNKSLYDQIVHKDGLLFFAIEYLLEKSGYKFICNQNQLHDVEIDFSLLNEQGLIYELIEVKMFKQDRPIDTQIGNIREAVSQTKKAVNKLMSIDPNYKRLSKSIVTNITDDAVYSLANRELVTDLKEYNITLYSMSTFYKKIVRL